MNFYQTTSEIQDKIKISLWNWKERLNKEYGEEHIFNITLYGSQNYNLETEKSDIDVKAIYIPDIKNAILEKKILSKELVNDKGEKCEIKDIREMFLMYLKQNINFIETLFTPFFYFNDIFLAENLLLREHADQIARCNPIQTIRSIAGEGISTISSYEKNTSIDKKYKYLARGIYLYLVLSKYSYENMSYKYCLIVHPLESFYEYNAIDLIKGLKSKNIKEINFIEENNIASSLKKDFFNVLEYSSTLTLKDKSPLKETKNFLNDLAFKCILKNSHLEN